MSMINEKWAELTAFTNNKELKDNLLSDIKKSYSSPGRSYHNLDHLLSLLTLCEENVAVLQNPIVVGFSIIYHDIIYDTQRRDNEEKSAEKAKRDLKALGLKRSFITEIEAFILATKDHEIPAEVVNKHDLAYFLDFDLAVLGLPGDEYEAYKKSIRQEYLQYRSYVYKEGRRQAMIQLLEKESLFYTNEFKERFEVQARENINNELAVLI